MEPLTDDQIQAHLARLPQWTRQDAAITREYRFGNFVQAMAFVNQIADWAESVQHHPDIAIRYNRVALTLTTHDAGGLTLRDTEFAAAADQFALAAGGE